MSDKNFLAIKLALAKVVWIEGGMSVRICYPNFAAWVSGNWHDGNGGNGKMAGLDLGRRERHDSPVFVF